MIKIIKECFSRSLDKTLKVNDTVSFNPEIEKQYIDAGFGIDEKKKTKERKQPIKTK